MFLLLLCFIKLFLLLCLTIESHRTHPNVLQDLCEEGEDMDGQGNQGDWLHVVYLVSCKTLFRIGLKNLLEESLRLFAEVFWSFEGTLAYLIEQCFFISCLEGELPDEKYVKEYPACPDVRWLSAVLLLRDDLRWHVGWGGGSWVRRECFLCYLVCRRRQWAWYLKKEGRERSRSQWSWRSWYHRWGYSPAWCRDAQFPSSASNSRLLLSAWRSVWSHLRSDDG